MVLRLSENTLDKIIRTIHMGPVLVTHKIVNVIWTVYCFFWWYKIPQFYSQNHNFIFFFKQKKKEIEKYTFHRFFRSSTLQFEHFLNYDCTINMKMYVIFSCRLSDNEINNIIGWQNIYVYLIIEMQNLNKGWNCALDPSFNFIWETSCVYICTHVLKVSEIKCS